MNENLIEKIIEIEWDMFESVNNQGGKASCQQDPETFKIMRTSQAQTWPKELLRSYLNDLESAKAEERNLLTEKYARMMKNTHPLEYENLKDSLPEINETTEKMIDEIVKINMEWDEIISSKYPNLRAKGRKTHSYEDTSWSTSIETYLRGELQTYSENTIKIYHEFILDQKEKNINLEELNLLNMVKEYGYDSLESANGRMGRG